MAATRQLSGFSGQNLDVWAGDSPGVPLVQSKARAEKTTRETAGQAPPFVLSLQVPQVLGMGPPGLDHSNLLHQSPSCANAGNTFRSHAGLTAFRVCWIGLSRNRNQLLSEGCRPLTGTNKSRPVSEPPGPDASASLQAI